MKRSFLEAFKAGLDLGTQLEDITIKRKTVANSKALQDVIYLKSKSNNAVRSEFEEDYENEPVFCEYGQGYSYQEEILRKANQIEEQETEDEYENEKEETFGEIQEGIIFGDRSNIQNFD
jgi:hypothetical protein